MSLSMTNRILLLGWGVCVVLLVILGTLNTSSAHVKLKLSEKALSQSLNAEVTVRL